jgi:Transposase DDE domain
LNNPLVQVPAVDLPTVAEPTIGCGCENPTLIGSIILGLFYRVLTALVVRAFTSCCSEIALLTNLPLTHADSILISQLYRKRWRVETLFQVATQIFHCEIKTLGYPRAAIFSFCMALVAYNLFSCLKGVLLSVHGREKIEGKLSYYYLSDDLEGTYRGMMIALPPENWEDFGEMDLTQFTALQILPRRERTLLLSIQKIIATH